MDTDVNDALGGDTDKDSKPDPSRRVLVTEVRPLGGRNHPTGQVGMILSSWPLLPGLFG